VATGKAADAQAPRRNPNQCINRPVQGTAEKRLDARALLTELRASMCLPQRCVNETLSEALSFLEGHHGGR
jgi:hypothetical protein